MIKMTNKKTPTKTKTLACAYIRMSTAEQSDSPERQKADLEKLAKRMDCRIIEWFEDHAQSGTASKNRKEFQRLMKAAPKAKWRAVLLSEQSRLSREETFDALAHLQALKKHGVRVATASRGWVDMDELGGQITALVDCHAAHDESLKISKRSVGGKVIRAQRGDRMGFALF